jgi:hypothetical protein
MLAVGAILPSPGLAQTVQDRRDHTAAPAGSLNTTRQLFDALDACWIPPPMEQSRPGTEITIRFSLDRAGAIMGEPRFTYLTPTLPPNVKAAYQRAIADALNRCTPFRLSGGLGGAIAGQPISTRFIDDRDRRTEGHHE